MPSDRRRYIESGAAYFTTSVTHEREPLLASPRVADFLVSSIRYHKYIFDYKVYGYVVMPNHLHLLLQPEGEFTISKIMNHLKGTFARKVNQVLRREEPIWQKSFHDHVCRSEKEVIERLRYMHQNPVEEGLVLEENSFPYSSARFYHGKSRGFIDPL